MTSRFTKKRGFSLKWLGLLTMVLLTTQYTLRAQYSSVAVTGYTQDVVANGIGDPSTSTTADVDGGGWYLLDSTFQVNSNSSKSSAPHFMPSFGVLHSADVSGLTFQLASYSANNSLRLQTGDTGTLTFVTPINAAQVFVVGTSGSGSSTINGTIYFADGSTQTFSGTYNDWFYGTPYARNGLERCNSGGLGGAGSSGNPRLYDNLSTSIPLSSQAIPIVKIFFQNQAGGVANIMGVGIQTATLCTGTPLAGTVVGASPVCLTTSTNLYLNGSTSGVGITYQWQDSIPGSGIWANFGSGTYVQPTSFSTGQSTGAITGTTYYRCMVGCPNSSSSATTPEFSISTVALPTVSVTPTSSNICNSAGSSTTITSTVSGSATYSWAPAAGLSSTTAASVTANPSSTTIYTVTIVATGCTFNYYDTVNVYTPPTVLGVTATPPYICSAQQSQLQVLLPQPSPYCTTSFQYGCYYGDYVDQVTISGTTLNNTGSGCGNNSYTNYPASGNTTGTISANNTYSITLANPQDYDQMGAWIDFNQDGVFQTNEFVFLANPGYTGNYTTYTGTFSVPANALSGTTRLRVICDAYGLGSGSSCDNDYFGETEDYTITITGGVPADTILWSPSISLNNDTSANPLAQPTGRVTYTVYVGNPGCTPVSDTVSVTAGLALASNPLTYPSTTNPVCPGATYTLSAGVTGGGGPYTFSWTSSDASITAATDSVTIKPLTTTTYSVGVTDFCGNTTSAVYTVTVLTAPVMSLVTTSQFCTTSTGDTLTVSGTATSYTWSPNTNISTTTGAQVIVSPTATTSYTVTGTNGICNTEDSVIVTLFYPPVIDSVVAYPTNICPGQSTTLKGYAPSASPDNYCVPSLSNSSGYSCYYEGVGDFSVTAASNSATILSNQNQGGCDVNYNQYNNLGTTYSQNPLVSGQTYNFSITNFGAFGSPGYTGYSIYIDYNLDGIYEANEQVYSAYNGQQGVYTGSFTVPLTALSGTTGLRIRADWGFSAGASNACDPNGTGETQDYTISVLGLPTASFTWSPSATLSSDTGASVTATPTGTFTYSVTAAFGTCTSAPSTVTVYEGVPLIVTSSAAQATPAPYCTPSYNNGTNDGDWINNVTLGTINNNTGNNYGSPSYTYFNGPTTNLVSGSTDTVNVNINNSFYDAIDVWIDYNHDGTFSPNELLGEFFTPFFTSPYQFSIPFNVPSGLVNGATRMRVRIVSFGSNDDPCAQYYDGEAEDYNVTIVGGNNANCGGITPSQITTIVSGGGRPYHYSWAPSTGLSSSTLPSPIANPTVTTSYTLTVTDSCGDIGYAHDTIIVVTPPTVTTTPANPTVCLGSHVSVTAHGATTYTWSPSAALHSSTGATVSASPSITTLYTVTGTANGCQTTDTFTLHVVSPPTSIFTTVSPATLCSPGTLVALTVPSYTGGYVGTGTWQYEFTDTSGRHVKQAYSSSPTYTFTPTSGGYYGFNVYMRSTSCTSSPNTNPGRGSIYVGISASVTGNNPPTCAPTGSINISNEQGLATWFSDNFAHAALNGATLYNRAFIANGLLTLNPSVNSTEGELVVNNPGINSTPYSVNFDLTVDSLNGGADGFSYSFADDAYPTNVAGTEPENGTGTKLKVAFDSYANGTNAAGIYLMYDCVTVNQAPNSSGVLAFSSNTSWQGSTNHVSIVVNNSGQVTVSVGNTTIFNNVQLPAGYATSNKSTWTHVFAARSGGLSERHAIDNLNITYGGFQFSDNSTNGTNGTWLNSTSINNLSAGQYTIWMRNAADTTCSKILGTVTLTNPALPKGILLASSVAYCTGSEKVIGYKAPITPVHVNASGFNGTAFGDPNGNTTSSPITIAAPGLLANQIDSIKVNVLDDYTYELILNLFAPNGSAVGVFEQDYSGASHLVNTVLVSQNDPNAVPLYYSGNPYTGEFYPDNSFSGFNGNASGTWNLQATNIYGDPYTLTNWTIYYHINNVNYAWSPSTSLSTLTNDTTTTSTTTSQKYYVTVSDSSTSCSHTDSINVTVNTLPTAGFAPYTLLTTCSTPVSLPIALTGKSPWTIIYNDGNSNYTINRATTPYGLSVSTSTTATYQIRKVTDANGCVASTIGTLAASYADSTRSVKFSKLNGGTVTPAYSLICKGTGQTFTLSGDTGTTIQWQYNANPTATNSLWTNYGTDSSNGTLSNVTANTYVRAVVSTPGCATASSTDGILRVDSSLLSVVVSNIKTTTAQLNWNTITGATYSIVVNGNTYISNTNSYSLTGLSACNTYNITVTANGSSCGGLPTGSASFTTHSSLLSLTLTAGTGTAIVANWSAGVGPYKLYYSQIQGPQNATVVNVTTTTYTIPAKNATAGTTYVVYVIDQGSTCTPKAQSGYAYYNTPGGTCTGTAPVITSATSTANTFSISWAGSAASYQVYYKVPAGNWTSYNVLGTSYTLKGAIPGTCYPFFVVNKCGTTFGLSSTIDTICTSSECNEPLNLELSEATCKGFTATWNSVVGASSYQVYCSATSGSGTPWLVNYAKTTNAATFSIFAPNTTITVYVKSNCTSGGLSVSSNVQSITTLSTGCKEGNDINLQANTATNTNEFAIYPNPNTGTFKVVMNTTATNATGTLEVMDMMGRLVYSKEVANNFGVISETMDLDNAVSSGIYMVHVRCGNDSHIAKVEVQR